MSAQAGTTFVLMVPNSFEPGFGRVWSGEEDGVYPPAGPPFPSPDPSLEDFQRGELFLNAIDPNDPNQVIYRFPLAYITRLAVARTSAAALARTRVKQDPSYTIDPVADNGNWTGQIIAFVDIPVTIPAAPGGTLYDIYPQRTFRTSLFPPAWGADPMQSGWNPDEPVQLRVLPPDTTGPESEQFSDFMGASASAWGGTEGRMKTMVPYPELRIHLATDIPPFGVFIPAAAEIKLQYPGGTVAIAGVALGKNDPSAAIVRWKILPGPAPVACSDSQTLQIHLIDPDALTATLRVALHHANASLCPAAVAVSDFSIVEWTLFEDDGDPVTAPGFAPTLDPVIY